MEHATYQSRPGDTLVVERLPRDEVFDGDIVLFSNGRRSLPIAWSQEPPLACLTFRRRGDAVPHLDSPVPGGNLLGKVSFIVRNGKRISAEKESPYSRARCRGCLSAFPLAARVFVGVHGLRQTSQGPSQIQTP